MDLAPLPETSEDYLLSPLLGFVPEYSSQTGNTWTIYLATAIDKSEKKGMYLVEPYSRLVTTELAREIRRALYSGQRYMFWGSSIPEVRSAAFYVKQDQPGLVYFDDEIYAFPETLGKVIGKDDAVSVQHTVK